MRAIVANWIETCDATSITESQTDSAVCRVSISMLQLFNIFSDATLRELSMFLLKKKALSTQQARHQIACPAPLSPSSPDVKLIHCVQVEEQQRKPLPISQLHEFHLSRVSDQQISAIRPPVRANDAEETSCVDDPQSEI